MARIVIELKKEKTNTKNPGDYLLMQLLSGKRSVSSLRTVHADARVRSPGPWFPCRAPGSADIREGGSFSAPASLHAS